MIENAAWLSQAKAFAEGLGKLKAKHELGQGAELTAAEVDGLIWAIRNLRAGVKNDPAEPA